MEIKPGLPLKLSQELTEFLNQPGSRDRLQLVGRPHILWVIATFYDRAEQFTSQFPAMKNVMTITNPIILFCFNCQ